jgi:hypothetical protein
MGIPSGVSLRLIGLRGYGLGSKTSKRKVRCGAVWCFDTCDEILVLVVSAHLIEMKLSDFRGFHTSIILITPIYSRQEPLVYLDVHVDIPPLQFNVFGIRPSINCAQQGSQETANASLEMELELGEHFE